MMRMLNVGTLNFPVTMLTLTLNLPVCVSGAYSINVGDHVKTLYCPPIPDIPALRNWRKEYGEAYFSASIRIQIFTGSSHPNSPTPSEISDDLNAPSVQ